MLRTIREEPEHEQLILQWQGYADLQGKDNLFERELRYGSLLAAMLVINYCICACFLFDTCVATTMLNAVFVLINFNVYLVYSVCKT